MQGPTELSCVSSLVVSAQTCPNATLKVTCTTPSVGLTIIWALPPGYCATDNIVLSRSAGTNCGNKNDTCGPFVATSLFSPSAQACTSSVLSVVATPQLNGTNVSCYSKNNLQYNYTISLTGTFTVPSSQFNDPFILYSLRVLL